MIATNLGIALGLSCSPCRDDEQGLIPLDDGAFTDPGDRDVQFPGMSAVIDGDSVVVSYPRGDRTVRVTLREVP